MAGTVRVILKKIYSLALIFNSLISATCVAGIIYAFYITSPTWRPYAPYLLDGSIFWLALAAALINIFPSAAIGRALHTGRFLFHHYVYGFFVLASTSALVMVFTPIPLQNLFFVDSNNVGINASRVFVLAGLTLLLDDLPDVNKRLERSLNWIKAKVYTIRRSLHVAQFITGCFAFYCSIAILLDSFAGSNRAVPNSFVIVSLFITGVTSFALVKRGAWLKITPPQPIVAAV
jgi:hypothetical protein